MIDVKSIKSHFSKSHLKKFISGIGRHEIFLVAGSIAYTTALSLAPFVLIILSLSSLLSLDMQSRFAAQVSASFGESVGATIKGIIENAGRHPNLSGLSGIIGLLVMAVSASALVTQLKIALDKINEHKASKKTGITFFLKKKFGSIALVLGFAFMSIASLILTTMISVVYPSGGGLPLQLASLLVNFILFSLLFTAIYRFVPSDHYSWKRCGLSGAVSTVFFIIGKTLIGMYLGRAGFASSYGAAGSLIILLVWVYYTALTLLISYEFSINLVLSE